MKNIIITEHARKRIERGDTRGKRTELSPEELTAIMNAPHAFHDGQYTAVYSPIDDKTLVIISTRQRSAVVTVYDTSRFNNRLIDILARVKAGSDPQFGILSQLDGFEQHKASLVTLGLHKNKQGLTRLRTLMEICHWFDLGTRNDSAIESTEFHQMIVDGVNTLKATGDLSKRELAELEFHIQETDSNQALIFPAFISFEILGLERPA